MYYAFAFTRRPGASDSHTRMFDVSTLRTFCQPTVKSALFLRVSSTLCLSSHTNTECKMFEPTYPVIFKILSPPPPGTALELDVSTTSN